MIHPWDLADFHVYKVSPKTLKSAMLAKALSTKLTKFSIKTFLEYASHRVMTPQAPSFLVTIIED